MSLGTRAGVRGNRYMAVFSALSLLLAFIPVFFAPLPALAAHDGPDPLDKTTTEAPNVDLGPACGLEILVVLDETGSIGSAGNEAEVVAGFQAFRSAMAGSGTTIGLIEFSSLPEEAGHDEEGSEIGSPQSARWVTSDYVNPNNATLVNYAVNNGHAASNTTSYNADGYTNWQEALWSARNFGVANGYPDLLILFTDGAPNTTDGDSHTDDASDAGSYGDTGAAEATQFAIPYANIIKQNGTHMLGFGLGLGGGGAGRLSDVTGPDGASSIDNLHPATTDYVTFNDPDQIADAFLTIATEFCRTTMNVTKWVPTGPSFTFEDGQPGGDDAFETADGWEYTLTDLVADDGTTEFVGPNSGTTSGGTVSFQWVNELRTASASVDLAETVPANWALLGGRCSINNGDPIVLDSENDWTISSIPDQATVDCDVYNTPGFITLSKAVQNDDGGTADPGDFTLNADGPTNISGKSGSAAVTGAPAPAGEYDLSEVQLPGYTQVGDWTCDADMVDGDTVTLVVGAHVLCSVLNTDLPPNLTLLKDVDDTYGGDAGASAWTLTATKQGGGFELVGTSGVSSPVPGGTYDLTEGDGPDGYVLVDWDCGDHLMDDDDTVTVASGDDVTCTVTNAALPAGLTLIKDVAENDFGATADPSAWTLSADGPDDNDLEGTSGVENLTLPEGEYALSESGGPDGWNGGEWSCNDGIYDPITDSVSLAIGEHATCTITNTPVQPELKLVKDLILGEGANESEGDFTLTAEGPITIQVPGADADNAVFQDAHVGLYDLSESGPAGYSQVGDWICIGGDQDGDQIGLAVGDSATCTVTNASEPAGLNLVKNVVNENGGLLGPDDFQLTLNGDNAPQGANVVVPNTEYTVSELPVDGYSWGGVVCTDDFSEQIVAHPVTLNEGQNVTCVVTNNDQPGTIEVLKQFAHDADVDPDSFNLTINGEPVDHDETYILPGNESYEVGETVYDDWVQVSLTCSDSDGVVDHPVELGNGQEVTCIIVNGRTPKVTVEKIAIGEDPAEFKFGGDLGDFAFTEIGGEAPHDVEPGVYVVTETPAEFWALTGIECSEGATADLNNASATFDVDYGDDQKCTFTNEQLPKSIEVITEGVCLEGVQHLKWVVNPVNFDGEEVTITWLDIDPEDPLYESTGNPLSGMMVWPGVEVDGDLEAIDWPGWIFENGQWSQGDDGYQNTVPTATIMFTVNPDIVAEQDYPGGAPDCSGPPAQIIVEKQVTGEASEEFAFTFTSVGFDLDDDTLAHGEQGSSGDLAPGDGYSVSETVPSGWEQVSATCDDGSDPSNIELSEGETVTCTFVNTIPDEVEPVEILPFTGMYADQLLSLGFGLVLAGALALLVTRKRGRHARGLWGNGRSSH